MFFNNTWNSQLIAHSGTDQSPIWGVSRFSMPRGLPWGGGSSMQGRYQTANHHTFNLLVLRHHSRRGAKLHIFDSNTSLNCGIYSRIELVDIDLWLPLITDIQTNKQVSLSNKSRNMSVSIDTNQVRKLAQIPLRTAFMSQTSNTSLDFDWPKRYKDTDTKCFKLKQSG